MPHLPIISVDDLLDDKKTFKVVDKAEIWDDGSDEEQEVAQKIAVLGIRDGVPELVVSNIIDAAIVAGDEVSAKSVQRIYLGNIASYKSLVSNFYVSAYDPPDLRRFVNRH